MKVVYVEIEPLISYNYAYFIVLKYTNQYKLNSLFKTTYIDWSH